MKYLIAAALGAFLVVFIHYQPETKIVTVHEGGKAEQIPVCYHPQTRLYSAGACK